jgi:GNAT superfamily N-acetyltransferase
VIRVLDVGNRQVKVRRAEVGEAAAIGALIAGAFHDLELSSWLAPDPVERIRQAIVHGDVEVVDGPGSDGSGSDGSGATLVGVAAWFRPGEIPDPDGYDEGLARVCGPHLERFVALDEAMHAAHPEAPEHAYLAFCAVRADMQGNGIGAALLESYHAGLDGSGTPAYLEASGLRSRGLYLRHGYADYAAPYGPTEDLAVFYPMWRDPR